MLGRALDMPALRASGVCVMDEDEHPRPHYLITRPLEGTVPSRNLTRSDASYNLESIRLSSALFAPYEERVHFIANQNAKIRDFGGWVFVFRARLAYLDDRDLGLRELDYFGKGEDFANEHINSVPWQSLRMLPRQLIVHKRLLWNVTVPEERMEAFDRALRPAPWLVGGVAQAMGIGMGPGDAASLASPWGEEAARLLNGTLPALYGGALDHFKRSGRAR